MRVPSCGDLIQDRYRLDEVLGEGATAWVFKAFDQRAERDIALKIVKPGPEGYADDTMRRFEREVRIIANLQDPHTVTLFGSGRTEAGHLFMVFEFVEGEDLATLIVRRTRLLPYEVIHVLEQLLASLREAHQNGLLHRDIKPENVRVFTTPDDELAVKLLDFGLAKRRDADASITRAGQIVGTPRYMSPEALLEGDLDAAADIYSLGIVALEMLFGRDALHGNDWSEQYDRLLTGHVFIFDEMEQIPEELMDVIEKMTQQKPERRYQTAAAALRALREVRDLLEEPIDTVDDATDYIPEEEDKRSRVSPAARPQRQPPREAGDGVPVRYVVIGAVLVAVLAGAVIWKADDADKPKVPRIPAAVLASQGAGRAERPQPAEPIEPASEVKVKVDGCGSEPTFERNAPQELRIDLTNSAWQTWYPTDYDNTRRHPVVMFFHHDDSDAARMIREANFEHIADREELVLIGVNSRSSRRAWEEPLEVEGAKPILDETAKQLCLDLGRVFLVGHGTGSHAVEYLSCEPWVTAVATTSYLPQKRDFICNAEEPRAALHIAPMDTEHVPVDGGFGCPAGKTTMISVDELEGLWRERNNCTTDAPTRDERPDGICRKFSCDAPFMICRIDGGFAWPGATRGVLEDLVGCDGEPSSFPSSQVIWDFFKSVPPLSED